MKTGAAATVAFFSGSAFFSTRSALLAAGSDFFSTACLVSVFAISTFFVVSTFSLAGLASFFSWSFSAVFSAAALTVGAGPAFL